MYARIEVGIFHNRGNLCNEKSGLQQNPFQIRGYSRIENSRIEVLLYISVEFLLNKSHFIFQD